MKAAIGWFIGLVFGISASAEPLIEGRVRLESGEPVADAQVRLFDLTDLRQGAIACAMTDGTGYFALPLATLGGQALPAQFTLGPNYPNPFNPSTIIPYQLAASSQVRLEVFNLLGQRIATLVDGGRPTGFHTATWHAVDGTGRAVGAGVYIYRMTVGMESQTGRMVLLDGQAGLSTVGVASVMPGVSGVGGSDGEGAHVYGLIVSGRGLAPYVDSSFRVESGMAPVELVVSSGVYSAGKVTDDHFLDLFGAFNDQQEEEEDEATKDEEETDNTASEGGPDLIVQSPSVSAVTLTPGQEFTLQVTVHNQGDEQAAATMLHYYRSNNSTITTSDTEVGTDAIDALDASATRAESIALTAPTGGEPGVYFYGACVASVSGESNTYNNCSSAVRITVSGQVATEEEKTDSTSSEGDEIAAVTPVRSGLGPTEAGKRAEEKIVATVRGTSGAPVAGASWRWSTDERSGWVFPAQGVTATDGRIVATWVAGSPGLGVLTLTVENQVSSITTEFTTESVVSRRPPSGAFYVWLTNHRRAAGYSIDVTPLTEPHGTYYAVIQWDGGYTGLQRGGDRYDRQLQFSVWDAPGGGAAQVIESGDDVVCENFGGEGTGRKCALNYPWRVGDTYRFEVTEAELDGGSAMTLHVTELATGDRRFVGTIRYAVRARLYYFGVFVEDFIGSAPTCLAQPIRSMAIRRSRAYINGEWHPITSGEVDRAKQDAKNPGTPACANLATREHSAGLEMVMGGRTMSDPDASRYVIIP